LAVIHVFMTSQVVVINKLLTLSRLLKPNVIVINVVWSPS
jgi:hypothetical protein